MLRFFIRLIVLFMTVSMFASAASGVTMFPLEPPDTSSPRATLESFILYSDVFYAAMRAPVPDPYEVRESLERAVRCFDLSRIAPTIAKDVGLESVLRLREVLDRIPLPDLEDVPDKNEVKKQDVVNWRIPHTELVIGKVMEGARLGAFLFTPETVDQLDKYYGEVQHLPYKDGAAQGIYEEYIYSSGWLIPDGFISRLPSWMKQGYLGQAMWQWAGLVLTIALGGLLLWPLLRWHRNWKNRESSSAWRLVRLVFPLSAMGLCFVMEYIINTQVNITGRVLTATTMAIEALFFLFVAWAILVGGNVVMHGIITSRHIKEEALDADVIKLVCRLVSFALVFTLFYRAGSYFGLPVTAVFASAGIAGVAVALAARETLANFFGGVSIFLDRPFRAGDYIVLDSGERGEVKAVGMRSTRLQTRDDVLITIPNSVITNLKIVNQSKPQQDFRIRIKIGVAYTSDLEKVEKVLEDVARNNAMVMKTPAPRVRLRTFGDFSINFELLVWASRPQERGRLTHELSKAIFYRFKEEGIEIPFPQWDIHMRTGKEDAERQAEYVMESSSRDNL
ncbi:MAG: mechanosensitive ion channel family protein [Proteobacteria bacterium]|nr:mechanosensitive ion channel family protein [Pseudomonadota bacterium]MBU1232526.1 mechanosensitive ion channel family protein [Pseudomonadota bacterium]MBU1420279.1 mechanosensitive ion channel family protein [Pseudomonadota bacterium]MBU1455608.1 mechanosensitive ion channel family protein [Pseudomonadota bacterium]